MVAFQYGKKTASTDEANIEENLAKRLATARSHGWFLPEHEAVIQLFTVDNSSSKLGHVQDLLEEIQKLGRVPIRQTRASTDEAKIEEYLAKRLATARSNGWFSSEHEAVIELLRPAQKTSLEKNS